MAGWFIDSVVSWLASFLLDGLTWAWDLLSRTAFTTPDVTGLPQVATISARSLLIANTSYLMVITVAGIIVMTRETVQARYGVAELAPHLVIGLVAANLATPICANLIGLSNALITALTGDRLAGTAAVDQMRRTVTAALTSPTNATLVTLIGLLVFGLTAMLLVTWLVRIGVMMVLVGIAPAALACHGLPQLAGVAALWWRSMLATLGTVVLQALALHVALSVFLAPEANLPALGMPGDPTGTVNLLIVACLLWAIVKIPGLMRRYVTGTGGNRFGAYLVRVVLVQQLARVLTHGLAGRRPHVTPRAGGTALTVTSRGPRLPRPMAPGRPPSRSSGGTPSGGVTQTGAATVASGSTPHRGPPIVPSHITPATAMPQIVPRWRRPGAYRPSGTGWLGSPARATPRPRTAQPSGTGWPAVSATPPRRMPPKPARSTPPPTPRASSSGTGWPTPATPPRLSGPSS